ncbi:SecY-interacting protein [Rheinheimera sp.]|uniref:SecY-interacting protein n=1 Tax=Rheinheimera sp. TaxID=1869214 RepID=UPI0026038F23|nr:SecY-interacting protein [Rheinheimera sp.]MCA1929871.1 SecY-interacting protein [Rheinheimera sp.]
MAAILAQKRSSMPGQFHQQFTQFVESYYDKKPTLISWVDPELDSPCQYGEVVEGEVHWRPVKAEPVLDLSKTQQALELQFPAELVTFYTSYFGGGLKVQHQRGELELLMSWHQADFERLQQNIIAHILMKRRLKQRETVFIAATDHDDYLISVLVATGEVYLEKVGMEVKDLLAPDLSTFLQQLSF